MSMLSEPSNVKLVCVYNFGLRITSKRQWCANKDRKETDVHQTRAESRVIISIIYNNTHNSRTQNNIAMDQLMHSIFLSLLKYTVR
jgi:hypothetical protein